MARIRMVTEDVRQIARELNLAANELASLPFRVKQLSTSISSAWQGGNADHYSRAIYNLAGDLQQEVSNLQYLSIRVNTEVGEWENADSLGLFSSSASQIFLPGAVSPLLMLPALMNYQNTTPVFWNGEIIKDWEAELDFTVADKWTSSKGWGSDESLELSAKISFVEGSYAEGQDSSNWLLGNYDIGGVVGEYGISKGESGAQFGVGTDGFIAGIYGEYDAVQASGSAVLGGSLLGLTLSSSGSAGSAQGFVGYKDGTVGASVGASAVAGEVGLGVNVAGANIGVKAGISVGLELGIKFGKDTEIKVGPFKIGLSFGKAITD